MLCLRDDIRRAAPAQRDKLSDDDGSLASSAAVTTASASRPLYPRQPTTCCIAEVVGVGPGAEVHVPESGAPPTQAAQRYASPLSNGSNTNHPRTSVARGASRPSGLARCREFRASRRRPRLLCLASQGLRQESEGPLKNAGYESTPSVPTIRPDRTGLPSNGPLLPPKK